MKSTLAACALLFAVTTEAGQVEQGSIPSPTELSILASDATNDTVAAGEPILVESEDSTATISVVVVRAGDGLVARGVRLSLQSENWEDDVYLDRNQLDQLRDEFAGLDRWYQRNEICGAQERCVQGIARCRPSQTIRQAICPGFYSTPDGERGALVGTPRKSFLFPSVGPSEFIGAINAVIDGLK